MKSATAEYLSRASKISERAEAQGRALTSEERKQVQDCLDQIRDIKASEAWAEGRISDLSKDEWESRRYREQAELKSQIASMNASLNGGGSFGDAVVGV